MKLKVKEILEVYGSLADAKITSLSKEERNKVFAILKPIHKVKKEFEEAIELVDAKLKPENWEELVAIEADIKAGKATLEQVKAYSAVSIYVSRRAEAIKEEGNRIIEIDAEPLAVEIVDKIFDENKWSLEKHLNVTPIIA